MVPNCLTPAKNLLHGCELRQVNRSLRRASAFKEFQISPSLTPLEMTKTRPE
jgi:hypothetical protein